MGYISAFVCAYETEKGKPDPAPYLLIAERLGASPGECLAVEDSPAGARSALGTGMTVVVVPDLVPVPDDVAGRAVVAGSLHEVARALLSRSLLVPHIYPE